MQSLLLCVLGETIVGSVWGGVGREGVVTVCVRRRMGFAVLRFVDFNICMRGWVDR